MPRTTDAPGEADLRAALLLARPALVWYDGLRTIGCNVCDRELPHDGVGDCPHGDHCPVAMSDALAARDSGEEEEGR